MKYSHLVLMTIAIVFGLTLFSCKKHEQETLTPKITDEKVEVTATTATFTWTVDWPGKLISVVEVSENEDMSQSTIYGSEIETENHNFTVTVTDLKMATKYYYRHVVWNHFYVDNKFVMDGKSFTTQALQKPTVTTASVSQFDFTNATAVGGGEVTSDGGDAVTERGIYFGTSSNPAATGTKIVASSGGTGSFTCTMTGLVEGTIYYVCAYATNGQGTSYGSEKSFSHACVDLGLPSGLLWATCNVGADSPEDYGDYFAWGETVSKDVYSVSTYQYCIDSYNTLTKYCNKSNYGYNGFTDNLTILLPEDDAATAKLGSDWRMPTREEWQELFQNTTHTWTTQNGVNGRLFTATNGNCLFLPAAGYRSADEFSGVGSYGDYWSSSLDTDDPSRAWYFRFYSDLAYVNYNTRVQGLSVRAVRSARQITLVP